MDTNNKSFESIRIGLASPEQIIEWAGPEINPGDKEVTVPETINYPTLNPEKGGL